MKRAIRYISFVLVLGVMFSGCYYLSYRSALKKLRQMEDKQDMNALFEEQALFAERMFSNLTGSVASEGNTAVPTPPEEEGDPEKAVSDGGEEPVVEVNQMGPDRIQPETKIVAETYDIMTGVFTMQEIEPDQTVVGMTREELSAYLAGQFENMPASEFEKGLLSNELITFSKDKVILRKTYDSGKLDFLYYIAVKNGEIVVYYNDKETVYEYTGISAITLKEEERLALMEGVKVKTAEELFSLLESYSS